MLLVIPDPLNNRGRWWCYFHLQMRTQRLREVRDLVPGHPVGKPGRPGYRFRFPTIGARVLPTTQVRT